MKRDLLIVTLLGAALFLTACADRGQADPVDWTQLAADAVPRFGRDDCGQTLAWNRELGRFEPTASADPLVIEASVLIRVDCDAEGEPAPALIDK